MQLRICQFLLVGDDGWVPCVQYTTEPIAMLPTPSTSHVNYEQIYLRPSSVEQGNRVIRLLRALVEHYAAHPGLLPPSRLVSGRQSMKMRHAREKSHQHSPYDASSAHGER